MLVMTFLIMSAPDTDGAPHVRVAVGVAVVAFVVVILNGEGDAGTCSNAFSRSLRDIYRLRVQPPGSQNSGATLSEPQGRTSTAVVDAKEQGSVVNQNMSFKPVVQ